MFLKVEVGDQNKCKKRKIVEKHLSVLNGISHVITVYYKFRVYSMRVNPNPGLTYDEKEF